MPTTAPRLQCDDAHAWARLPLVVTVRGDWRREITSCNSCPAVRVSVSVGGGAAKLVEVRP